MTYVFTSLVCLLIAFSRATAQDVLIVADENPAMEVLAKEIRKQGESFGLVYARKKRVAVL